MIFLVWFLLFPLSQEKVLYSDYSVWAEKPVLSYFVLTGSLRDELREDLELSQPDWQMIDYLARREADALSKLYQESQKVVQASHLNIWEKRFWIWYSGYNSQVRKILQNTEHALATQLNWKINHQLHEWIGIHWLEEKSRRGISPNMAFPRSFEVYATRYDSGGAYTVALPDKCLKFSNAGNRLCEDMGYAVGQNYSVFLSYQKGTAATVLESGPWNVDDNYWAGFGDSQPRRMFADLGLGIPEAQAAFFNGYNGGLDQFGRKVTAPFGIDLARQVSIDIGLEPGVNDWITVSFMWTEGWDSDTSSLGPTSATQSSQQVEFVQTSTANPTGTVIHEVKFGQTLWAIADAYQVNLQDIYSLNDIPENGLIVPGQMLVIRQMTDTPLPSSESTTTFTPSLAITRGSPTLKSKNITSTPESMLGTQLANLDQTEIVNSNVNTSSGKTEDTVFIIIMALSLIGLALILIGSFFQRRA